MDNYKKIKSIMLQLQILGNGRYDDHVVEIQSKLSSEPYTASNEAVIYANTVLNDIIQSEDKNKLKKLAKYTEQFGKSFTYMDEADDFINDDKSSDVGVLKGDEIGTDFSDHGGFKIKGKPREEEQSYKELIFGSTDDILLGIGKHGDLTKKIRRNNI